MSRKEAFEESSEPQHSHRYNPANPHTLKPKGECPGCDKIWEKARQHNEEITKGDPFRGLG